MLYKDVAEEQTVLMDSVREKVGWRTGGRKQRLLAVAVAVLGLPFLVAWKRDS